MFRSWRRLKAHGTWPAPGGQDDQAAAFLEAVDYLDGELAAYEQRQMDRAREEAKRRRG